MFIIIADDQSAKKIKIGGIYSTKELAVAAAEKIVDEFTGGDPDEACYYQDNTMWAGFDFNVRIIDRIEVDRELLDMYIVD